MADTTYAVKISDELKGRLQKLVEESGQSSKDFFADMISQFELFNAKKQTPILAADIDELVKLTTRINNIFINVGERVFSLHETYRLEAENQTKEKGSLISLLQQQVDDLKRDAADRDEQLYGIKSENELLKKEKSEEEKNYTAEISQLKDMNLKNNEIISGYSEKINNLNGLLDKYQAYADENEVLKQESAKAQRVTEELKKENEKLNSLLAEMIQKQSEDMERQKEKLELERDRELLKQREQLSHELDEIRNAYQDKINQLLQINTKSIKDPKKKLEGGTDSQKNM